MESIRMLKGPIRFGTRVGLGPGRWQCGFDVPGVVFGPLGCALM